MNDAYASDFVPSVIPAVAPPDAPPTAGRLLRQAREAAGLHIAALAVSMKVPVRKLEALEADRLDLLPDAVFARALASSMCRALKIDPAPVLGLLPSGSAALVSQHERGINAPFRGPGDAPAPSVVSQLSRPTMLAVLVLLMGAAVILLLPARFLPSSGSDNNVREAETVVMPPVAAPTPAEPNVVLPPSDAPVPNSDAGSTAAAPTAAAVTPPATVAPAATMASPAVPAAATLVAFEASGSSWVEVVDSTGAVVLRRTLASGESASASGALPLTVTVGRADLTRVKVRGKDFNLVPQGRDNVARFEVK
ncbi:helix-turn-helix domain-containing protein [Variovorax sp. VNK109]|uniref:helix-turn-helix domain-containing protein n=1 Tax=Variovorax sp. VNK109 TaxID=3400919 RepID=UPI003C00241D